MVAPPEFIQDPEPEPTEDPDGVSIPAAESATPLPVGKSVNSSPRKQKAEAEATSEKPKSIKSESKPVQKPPAKAKEAVNKQSPKKEAPKAQPVKPVTSPKIAKKDAKAISIPVATTETPVPRSPAKETSQPKKVAEPEKPKKLPLSPKVEKKKNNVSKPTLSKSVDKSKETDQSAADTYTHKSRSQPSDKKKYGVGVDLQKDLLERDSKSVPNGKVIPFGYQSLPGSPTKPITGEKPVKDTNKPKVTNSTTSKATKPTIPPVKTPKPGATVSSPRTNENAKTPIPKSVKIAKKTPIQVCTYAHLEFFYTFTNTPCFY